MQFTNRRQRFGEKFAALGSELEKLSRLAYPECSPEIRDKIACAQFVSAISDKFVKQTLQLEGITSLDLAIERAKTIRGIQRENFERDARNFSGDSFEGGRRFPQRSDGEG